MLLIYAIYKNNHIYLLNLEGIFKDSLQLRNILLILVTLEVSHFDISGNEDNVLQSENILLILVTLLIPFNFIFISSLFLSISLIYSFISYSLFLYIILQFCLLLLTNVFPNI